MTFSEKLEGRSWKESWIEGWIEGWQEGWQEGRKEGFQEARKQITFSLLKEGVETKFIVKITNLPLTDIECLRATLGNIPVASEI